MRAGFLGASLLALLTGCASQHAELQIRPVGEAQARVDDGALATAEMLLRRGEYALAADAYRKAIRNDPAGAAAYNGLAISYDRLGRFDLSRRYYELALARAPREAKYYRNLARSLESQGETAQARELFAQADAVERGPVGAPDTVPAEPRRSLADIACEGIASAARVVSDFAGPRLERLSMGEVLLATRSGATAERPTRLAGSSITVAIPPPVRLETPPPREALTSLAATRPITVTLPPPDIAAPDLTPHAAPVEAVRAEPAPADRALVSLSGETAPLPLVHVEGAAVLVASAAVDPAELLRLAVTLPPPEPAPSCGAAVGISPVREYASDGSAMRVFMGDYTSTPLRGTGRSIELPLLYPASANLPVAAAQAAAGCGVRMVDAPPDASLASLWRGRTVGAA